MATATKPKKKKQVGRGVVAVLNENEKVVVHLYIKHGSRTGAIKAAEELGVKPEDIKVLLQKAHVARYLQQYNHTFLKTMARYELSKVTRFPVTREDVIAQLHSLALTPPEETKGTIEGQVKALETISDILGLKFSPRDADTFFKDKTETELRNYALYGTFDPPGDKGTPSDAATEPVSKP